MENTMAFMSFGQVVEFLGFGPERLKTEYFMGNSSRTLPDSRFWEPADVKVTESRWTLYERDTNGANEWVEILNGPGTKREGVWKPNEAACLARHMVYKTSGVLGDWLRSREDRRKAANPELFGVW